MSDLFGADLPVEGDVGICFEWRDGPFLNALKNGYWIVLDEVCLRSATRLQQCFNNNLMSCVVC